MLIGKSLYRKNHIDILSGKISKSIDIPFKLDFKLRGVLRKKNLKQLYFRLNHNFANNLDITQATTCKSKHPAWVKNPKSFKNLTTIVLL